MLNNLLGLFGVIAYSFGSSMLLRIAFAQDIQTPSTPTTIMGAFIVVSIGAFSLLGWVVRTLFQMIAEQGKRLDAIVDKNTKSAEDIREDVRKMQEAIAHIPRTCPMDRTNQATEVRNS